MYELINVSIMSRPVAKVSKKNTLKHHEGTLRGTRLEKGTCPQLGDTRS